VELKATAYQLFRNYSKLFY